MESVSRLRKLAIILVVVSFAMPVRFWVAFGPFTSISVLDFAVIAGGIWLLLLALAGNGVDLGHKVVFAALCIPLVCGFLSLAWSQDTSTSIRWTLVNAESLVAYLFAVRLFRGLPPGINIRAMGLFVTVCILGAILALIRVPGFEPRVSPDSDLGLTSNVDYFITFYARLSHPFIGLSNDFASALNCYVLVLFTWGFVEKKRVYLLLSGLTALAITFTLSRGVLIPLILASLVLFLHSRLRRMFPYLAGMLVLMSLSTVAYYSLVPEVGATIADRTTNGNVEDRMSKLVVASGKISERPALGYGAGVAADHDELLIGGAHNVAADMMLYFGVIPGFIAFFAVLSLPCVFLGWKSAQGDIRLVTYAVGLSLTGQVLVFLSETSFDAPVLRVFFYYFIGASVALLTAMSKRPHIGLPSDDLSLA